MRANAVTPAAFLLLLAVANVYAAETAYVIQNARIITVSGPVIDNGAIVMHAGRIRNVGRSVKVPKDSTVIDASGLSVYPGLFDADSQLGMNAAIERTMGDLVPQLQVFASFHFEDSEADRVVHNGVTQLMVRPFHREYAAGLYRPGLMPGQSSIVSLQGGTPGEMAIEKGAGVVLNFPTVGPLDYTEDERFKVATWSELKSTMDQDLERLQSYFSAARTYMSRKEGLSATDRKQMPVEPGFEALIPVLKRVKPLLIDVANHVDIRNAVGFAEAQGVDFILLGAEEAWRVVDFLKQHKVRLIVTGTYKVPASEDDSVNILHRLPAILHEHGIPFALSSQGAVDARLLPYLAGTAAAYGLPKDAALRSITLSPAELLGIDDELGSIDAGKRANLVVTDGDIMEISTKVQYVFVDGKLVDHGIDDTRLYQSYIERN